MVQGGAGGTEVKLPNDTSALGSGSGFSAGCQKTGRHGALIDDNCIGQR